MAKTAEARLAESLKIQFGEMSDPRVEGRTDHNLIDIIALAVLAFLCGAEDWSDIELVSQRRKTWLSTFLELRNGIPTRHTIRRVFCALDRKQFAACLFSWMQALHEATDGKLIAIDGKTLRHSYTKKALLDQLHLVTAFATENGLTLGQVAVEDKSNEITAIPQLLAMLDIKGSTVTIDSMGCQTAIAEQIRVQKGHYLLGLKGNQSGLEKDMKSLFDEAANVDFKGVKHSTYETTESGHGRKDQRIYVAMAIPKEHPQRKRWKDLQTLLVVGSARIAKDGSEVWEQRMYISDRSPEARELGTAVRGHWKIENTLHWSLDVTFHEDAQLQHDRNGAANLGAVRRLALNVLRQETNSKLSLRKKRLVCAIELPFMLEVIASAQAF